MKHREIFKRISAIFVILFILCSHTSFVYANSGSVNWDGTDANGTLIEDEDCPLVVQHENLLFHIQDFPEWNQQESYTSTVTAEYTFYNPTDYTVTATLLFPFGVTPSYYDDYENSQNVIRKDAETYDITINGESIEKQLRHTIDFYDEEFDAERDMHKVLDTYLEDDFYKQDTIVTEYIYTIDGVDLTTYQNAIIVFQISDTSSNTRVFFPDFTGDEVNDDYIRIYYPVRNKVRICAIGTPIETPSDYTIYTNGHEEEELQAEVTVETNTTTLREYIRNEREEGYGVSEVDWYNAMIEQLKHREFQYGNVYGTESTFLHYDELMWWYEYTLEVAPQETVINAVTAPIYPNIYLRSNPKTYDYTYLLSPAKSWASFGSIEIKIQTPYYVLSGSEDFEKVDDGYTVSLEQLPDKELTFSMASEESVENTGIGIGELFKGFLVIAGIGLAIIIGVIAIIVTLIIKFTKKKS